VLAIRYVQSDTVVKVVATHRSRVTHVGESLVRVRPQVVAELLDLLRQGRLVSG
jgi:hypothetical protein